MASRLKSRGITARARLIDRAGRFFIAVGGVGVIAAVLGIFFFILGEAYPLFTQAQVDRQEEKRADLQQEWLALGVDPYRQLAYVAGERGVDFLRLDSGRIERRERPAELDSARIVSAYSAARIERLALGLDDGRVLLASVDFHLDYEEGERRVRPAFEVDGALVLDAQSEPLTRVFLADDGDGRSAVAAIAESGRLLVALREQQQGLLGPGELRQEIYELDPGARPTTLLIDARIRRLLVGTESGEVREWSLRGAPSFEGSFAAAQGAAVTALAFVLGDVSVIAGDASGGVSTWFRVGEGEDREYRRAHLFSSHAAPVRHIDASQRDKQFITSDANGVVALHHMTSEQTFLTLKTDLGQVAALSFAPKADGFLVLGAGGRILHYTLDSPHPEITLAVLFGQVWYEGYPNAEYVWQSTGGTDEFEPKLSLIPLVFGTAKGTLYAMLFALPLAILAAIYTAEFANPRVRTVVKPTVEVMASLPSVILGFLAGLWLAPLLEQRIVGTLLLFPTIPAVVLLGAWAWQWLPQSFARRLSRQVEIYLLVLVSLLATWVAFLLGPAFEAWTFGGDFLRWLSSDAGVRYDQRNCLVVGFAMGFAVIPLIFTICEDALSSVPRHLRAGSLALGATRWQTAVRVVLPMAVPGIFSASMIGFGRAVGETMIVLMATGNTPIMDWNIFTGMRTISANIAVELPEAPHQGTLYRVLFLSGLLLFGATFCINTLAEVVRQRLRERYSRL